MSARLRHLGVCSWVLLNTQIIIANLFQRKSRIVVSTHCEAMSLKPKVQQNVCHATICNVISIISIAMVSFNWTKDSQIII